MSIVNHPDYRDEYERLNYTLEYLKNYFSNIINKKNKLDSNLESSVKHYNSDNSQQYIDLIIGTNLEGSINRKLKAMERAHTKPYFARVDFKENGSEKNEKLYIGKVSLLREEDNRFLIVDWRAPIANLYYEGRIGKSGYICPDGKINGYLGLKRQFTIEDGKLIDFFDIDITTNDDFLQASLGANADNRLKDIVSTIQAEQNRVIRADMWRPLIVQGAAGGGKTTIALHRIAYLLYTYEKSFGPENFMIIAPSKFFLSYISEVLPELGVENVKQTTFEDFAMEIIGKKFKLSDVNEKLASFVNSSKADKKLNDIIKEASGFKSSSDFKNVVLKYMKQVEYNFLPKQDLKIESYILYTYDELQNLFLEEYKDLPMIKRINEIKKHINSKLKREKQSILGEIESTYDRKIEKIKSSMEDSKERRNLIIEVIDKRDTIMEKIKKASKSLLKDYLSRILLLTPQEYYKNLIINKDKLNFFAGKYVSEDVINYICESSEKLLKEGTVEIEDLAPLMLIKYLIYGLDEKIKVRHIIIDEAQDYSLFQFYVLKNIIKNSSFTILGDLCQGIHSYRGTNDWNHVRKEVFGIENCSMLTLEQSYRTTIEIMETANLVIKNLKDNKLPLAMPVIRHGEPVKVEIKNSFEEIGKEIVEKINNMQKEGFKSAAIICKTADECVSIRAALKGLKNPPKIITGKEKEFSGGVVIVPSYLVKGLEFDMVIIANASKKVYTNDELDIKLLYVAMTRPLHRLYIYSLGEAAVKTCM